MAEQLIGTDPRPIQAIDSFLYVKQVQAPNGVNQRAIAAIGNALLDLKGKALGVPVYELFGGPVRTRIPVYWSHCGTYRVRNHEIVGSKPLRTYDDIAALGAEVKSKGFKALKTNIMPWDGEKLTSLGQGFGRSPGWPALNCDRTLLNSLRRQLTAFREGAGADMGIHLDIELPLQDRGKPAGRHGGRAVRPDVAGNRQLGSGGACPDPLTCTVPDCVAGIGHREARLSSVPRRLQH